VRRTAAIALVLCALGAGPAAAEAPPWTVDMAASRIAFAARQMRVPVPGRFERFSAAIRFDPADLATSKAVIDIDVASVTTPNRDIETEIKREPWFDAARYPTARFETTAFAHKGGDRYEATGTLTLRGVTLPVALSATIRIADDPDSPGMLRAEATGEVEVRRTAFGIGQGQWRDTSIVADEVVISIGIVGRRPKAGR